MSPCLAVAELPGRPRDPALVHPIDPDFIAFSLEAAGFQGTEVSRHRETYELIANR